MVVERPKTQSAQGSVNLRTADSRLGDSVGSVWWFINDAPGSNTGATNEGIGDAK